MILLDTNVVSELMRLNPNPKVMAWFETVEGEELLISAITEAELWFGVCALPKGKRRNSLEKQIAAMLADEFAGNSLPFESTAAYAYGSILSGRMALGRPISHEDCQIAAIAQVTAMKLATRNVRDFEQCGIDLINPWA